MGKSRFHISKLKPSVLQGAFDFEAVSSRRSSALAVEYRAERYAFLCLVGILGTLVCAYFYFVVSSVLNVVAERTADTQSAEIQTTIGSMEQQYFALTQSLTPGAATDMGLAPVQNTQYVYRPGNAADAGESVHAI